MRNSFIPPCVNRVGSYIFPQRVTCLEEAVVREIATFVLCSIFCAKSLIRGAGLGVRGTEIMRPQL